MWAEDPIDGSCWLGGILIDRSVQRQGYGRLAIEMVVAMLAVEHGYWQFALSYALDNPAKYLYRTLDFTETGEWEDNEVVTRLLFIQENTN